MTLYWSLGQMKIPRTKQIQKCAHKVESGKDYGIG